MDRRERERRLRKMIESGNRAKHLTAFIDEFMEASNERAINEMLTTAKDPSVIKADLRASKRLCDYIRNIISMGVLAEQKLNKLKETE